MGSETVDAIGTHFSDYIRQTSESLPNSVPTTYSSKNSETYELNSGTRLALIFNHENFEPSRHISPREGSEKDSQALISTFEALDFEVEECLDYTFSEIQNKLLQVSSRTSLSIFCLFILSHGEENGVLYAYDGNYRLEKHVLPFLLPLNAPLLAGKPKCIFIQACQGNQYDKGFAVCSHDSASQVFTLPSFSDFLIYQASYRGHLAFRSPTGSWFIQSLCEQINTSSVSEDLLSILTRVSRTIALYKISNTPDAKEFHECLQIPLRQDTLLRALYLKRPNKIPCNSSSSKSPEEDQNGGTREIIHETKDKMSIFLKRKKNCLLFGCQIL